MAGRFVSFQNCITKEQECVRIWSNCFLQNKKGGQIYWSKTKLMHHYSKLKLLIHPRKFKNKTCHSSISNRHLLKKEREKNNKLECNFWGGKKKKYLQGFYPSFFSSSPLAFRSQANSQNWADALAQTIWCVQWNWGCCTTARFVLTTWSVGLWRVGNTSRRFRFCSSNTTPAAPLSKSSWKQHWQTKVVSMLGGFINWASGMIHFWLLNHHLCGMFIKELKRFAFTILLFDFIHRARRRRVWAKWTVHINTPRCNTLSKWVWCCTFAVTVFVNPIEKVP